MEKNSADAIAKAAAKRKREFETDKMHQMAQFENKLEDMHANSEKNHAAKIQVSCDTMVAESFEKMTKKKKRAIA